MIMRISAVLFLLLSSTYTCTAGTDQNLIVETTNGKVLGKYSDNGNSRVFQGIPYGGHVDGENRWTNPKPPADWDGIFDTTKEYPTACPQKCSNSSLDCPPKETQTENCLFLNVYTPKDATPDSNLSVLVFIHGGDFIHGYSTAALFDGTYLASNYDIIVVTINYRLGALGFLVLERAIEGNYGIKDQRLAFHWVQENIENFGGNKDMVTISGESAGAMSVAIHMTSNESEGLFHQAIVESSGFGIYYRELSYETWNGVAFAVRLGCVVEKVTDCLQHKGLEEILNASHSYVSRHIWSEFLTWAPAVESDQQQSLNLFLRGEFSRVPTIMGTNGDEGLIFIYGALKDKIPASITSINSYEVLIFALFIEKSMQVYMDYPPEKPYNDQRPQLSNVTGDYVFYCPTILSAKSLAEQSQFPVYSYLFNHSYPDIPYLSTDDGNCKIHSCHGAELFYVFHTYDEYFTEGEKRLADTVSRYWANFVKTGNPNTAGDNDISDGSCAADGSECTVWPEFRSSNKWSSWYMDVDDFKTVFPKDSCKIFDKRAYGRNIFRLLSNSNDFFPIVEENYQNMT